ncbi:hypothetical protein Pmar_PMAR029622 [Perkinsus marinus ATCC 50983]|uniref:Uncharacterized protein n=1 Tax=Perkinsus marinus (strain ATCC 50983 / TXsc) TaxID=423536 RepID=C5KWZ8_PERM5|nr:hypothetical protein Pmar_PMAR029622 [Perkinsus marinus ATCC 50983]EER11002.1 hypothetical protein Pmar_PMAR029622 [Perkinsus marinus ATCC 50983]|eukprot:XP_002779207.1 hypothetical protein Pmar_PMAR029622 [Perkinsus marinus ATCC 50983]
MRVPDVHQTPREIELMGDVAREMYPDFRLVARDAPLPIVGFDYCASLDEIPPEEDILSAEVPLAQRGAILDEIMNDEQDTTTDTESAGFRSILEGEIDGGDGAEEPAGESDSDESTDSDEEPCGGRTFDPLPVATKRRKFLRWRTKAQSASYFRIDHEVGGAMERAFTSLRLEYPRATAAELLKLYTRDYLMKERANHEIDGRRPISYHPTSILYVEQWLSGYRKRSSFAGSAGSFNLKSMEAFGNLERSLAAQSSNKSPTEAVVVVHEHATLDSGPAEITANDLQDELETRPRKRMRISPAEGPVQQAIQTRAQDQVPRQSPREFKGRKCRFCGKILRKGFNEHIYDGSTHGLCPYRDAAAENKKDEEKKLEDERVEAAIQQALMADTLMGADKTGRKCSKCRRPYKSWLVRKGRSLHHQQFRAPVGNDKYTQVIWCPLLDGEEELETLQNEQIQRKRERWREANERKKNK